MNDSSDISNPTEALSQKEVFSKYIEDLGTIVFRPLAIENDIAVLHNWVTKPYAQYWEMQDHTVLQVQEAYQELTALAHHDVFMGYLNDQPIFLMERYIASEDSIAQYYPAKPGDYGMHILVGPATKRIANFTWHVFATVMEFLFADTAVKRVVVEPDVRNEKIHVLNKRAGFRYQKEIQFPHKKASLAFCERTHFQDAIKKHFKHKNHTP